MTLTMSALIVIGHLAEMDRSWNMLSAGLTRREAQPSSRSLFIDATVIVALGMALNGCDQRPAQIAAPAAVTIVPGRYTIVHSPLSEPDTMLLDTAKGKTWRLVSSNGQSSTLYWEPVGVLRPQSAPPQSDDPETVPAKGSPTTGAPHNGN